MMKLYHYVHCPFCVRVRLACDFLSIKYESIVLTYDDEKTPISLSGKKMLPILLDGKNAINESLEIIKFLDSEDSLNQKFYLTNKPYVDKVLEKIGFDIHSLAMPYWVYTPEFDEESRMYFKNKKEVKRGAFNHLVLNRETYIKSLISTLEEVDINIDGFFLSRKFSILDILLYSHLVAGYVVPGMNFTQKISEYMQRVENDTGFQYHSDFWKSNEDFSSLIRKSNEK